MYCSHWFDKSCVALSQRTRFANTHSIWVRIMSSPVKDTRMKIDAKADNLLKMKIPTGSPNNISAVAPMKASKIQYTRRSLPDLHGSRAHAGQGTSHHVSNRNVASPDHVRHKIAWNSMPLRLPSGLGQDRLQSSICGSH